MLSTSHKTASEPSNPLFRALRTFLKLTDSQYATWGRKFISVQTGLFSGLTFIPDTNYCKVLRVPGNFQIVSTNFNFHCNYSITVLFYKMFKHGLLDEVNYSRLLKICDNEKKLR